MFELLYDGDIAYKRISKKGMFPYRAVMDWIYGIRRLVSTESLANKLSGGERRNRSIHSRLK